MTEGEKPIKINLDFSLSGRFGIVEQTIFRLVLGGVIEVKTIRALLSIYTDEVIANAIQKLVNYQILHADFETQTVHITEIIKALMEGCLEHSEKLSLPIAAFDVLEDNRKFICDDATKRKILASILPGLNTGFLVKSLDFVIQERKA